MFDHALLSQAEALGASLQRTGQVLTLAESCTGGLVSALLTEISGSSAWLDSGHVTYSNAAKIHMLGVSPQTLQHVGAVSEETALEMALGALFRSQSRATLAVSVTGIAGPSGGTTEKPVGTVCFGWAKQGGPALTRTYHFEGNRHDIRMQSVRTALDGLSRLLSG